MAKNQSTKERLILFIKSLGIGQGKFEKECGLSNGWVNNIKAMIKNDKLQKISLRYPDLNTVWLLTGEGEMLLTDATGRATDGMGEDGLKERITALEKLLDERDARIADLEGRQEERLNAMQGNIDSLTEALNKALDLVKSTK